VHPDVLIVDDGSPDGTADLVRELARAHPGRVHLLERTGERGLGPAYAAGFRWAVERHRWDVVVQMDADGSHDPRSVDDLVAATSSADLVLGSRYVPGGRTVNWPWRRELLSRAGNAYARAVLHLPVHDVTGGFKAWRTDLLEDLDLRTPRTQGFGFQVETTSEALDRGARCVEVPVVFADRELGTSKMRAGIAVEALTSIWRMRHRRPADAPNVVADPGPLPAPEDAQKLVRHSRERSSAT
jgi:dolichol-phosphate mannosyltransferase